MAPLVPYRRHASNSRSFEEQIFERLRRFAIIKAAVALGSHRSVDMTWLSPVKHKTLALRKPCIP